MEASAFPSSSAAASVGGRSSRVSLLRLRSDEQLLAQFRMGSDEAFGVLFHRYQSRLLSYTRRMLAGSQQDAEDALQDVFLRAYGALRADERPVSVRAWLYRVAHNRCIDHIRRATPEPEDIFAVSRPTSATDPEAAFARREDLRQVVADLGALPETQRSALLLREMEGLSYVELAATLDLTMPAVKSVLVRARTSLAESSEARGTACVDIRTEIDGAFDAGSRPDSRSKRHMKECDGCRDYHTALRATSGSRASGGPFAFLAKLLGLGGATGAGTGVAGGAAAGTTAVGGKIAALVCCGMVVAGAGAAVELPREIQSGERPAHASPAVRHASSSDPLARALHLTPALAAATSAAVATQPARSTGSATTAPPAHHARPRAVVRTQAPATVSELVPAEPVAPAVTEQDPAASTDDTAITEEPPVRHAPTAVAPAKESPTASDPTTPTTGTGSASSPTETPAAPTSSSPAGTTSPPTGASHAPTAPDTAPTSPAPTAPTGAQDAVTSTY